MDKLESSRGRSAPGQKPEPAVAKPAAGDDAAPPRILLAEDDPVALAAMAHVLRMAGYEVLEAHDGAEALDVWVAEMPSLVLVDQGMPRLTGLELVRAMAGRTAAPAVFLTATFDEKLVADAIAAGAMTYLLKPIGAEQLLAAVRAALERARDMRAMREHVGHLESMLERTRTVSMAVGLIMARLSVGREEAAERLRRLARSRRVRLEEVATELLQATESVDQLHADLAGRPAGTRERI